MQSLLAVLISIAALARADEACTASLEGTSAMRGEALLQTKHSRESPDLVSTPIQLPLVSEGEEIAQLSDDHKVALLSKAGYNAEGYLGAPHCVPEEQAAANRHLALVSTRRSGDPVGMSATLDAAGFKQTTSLCCPHEMEMFFGRVLLSKGLEVCSKPHVQGLMHWFTCVPDMDFQYVLDVIDNGNPCKYWGPMGQTCPTLSPACVGHHCGLPLAAKAPATVLPTTEPPSTAAATTEASTTSLPKTTTSLTTTTTKTTTTKTTTTKTTTTKTTTTKTTTTKTTTTSYDCGNDVLLTFSNETVNHRNFGGWGPDTGPENMRFAKLGSYDGKKFDLLLTSTSDKYDPNGQPGWNNVYGDIGFVFMIAPGTTDMKFTIVETGTDTPMPLPKFYFSFFDLDTSSNIVGDGREMLSVKGHAEHRVGPDTELNIFDAGDGYTAFEATVYGDVSDNPKSPMGLNTLQQNRAVTLEFRNTAEFWASYDVSDKGSTPGRDVAFAGKSTLACDGV